MYLDLSAWDILIAAALVLVNGLLSVCLGLGLERRLAIASLRTVVQLLLIGLVLEWIFESSSWPVVVALMLIMTIIAGTAAVNRTSKRFPGIWINSITAVMFSCWLVTAFGLLAIVRPAPWYVPQYSIPLLGMILGNALNGISLGLDRLGGELLDNRGQIEVFLALGATRWEAARKSVREAIRTGMIPIINSMMVVGIVSLPGMMTGQLLAGAAPLGAVRYQIVIMFLIAAATALGTVSAVLLSYLRLFNQQHQFLHGRIRSQNSD